MITVPYDNNAHDPRLKTAWGFSCLVEGLEKTILFDTGGNSSILLRNMRALGIEPAGVDTVVISHVHGDHVGGLAGFLVENHSVTVYLPQSFPQSIKRATVGRGADLVEVAGPIEVCARVHSTGELGASLREQSLLIETTQGLVVITGCAHPGVVNSVRQAKQLRGGEMHLVLGGFHLGGASAGRIAAIAEQFQKLGVHTVAPCHCSGEMARRLFGYAYGKSFVLAGVGSRLEVRECVLQRPMTTSRRLSVASRQIAADGVWKEEVDEMGRGRGGSSDGSGGRGAGRGPGRMGGPKAAGPGGYCVCPVCGQRESHLAGSPCYQIQCPKCGARMTRE